MVAPPVAAVPPVEVVPSAVVVPPEAVAPPVEDGALELGTLESGRLTGDSVFEQFPMVAATRNSPERCKIRKQQGRVADGVFDIDRVLLRNQ
jgi:hypothetical protein